MIGSLSILAVKTLKTKMANEFLHPIRIGHWPEVPGILELRMQNGRNMWFSSNEESGWGRGGFNPSVHLCNLEDAHFPPSEIRGQPGLLGGYLKKKTGTLFSKIQVSVDGWGLSQLPLKHWFVIKFSPLIFVLFILFLLVDLISDYDLTSPLNA